MDSSLKIHPNAASLGSSGFATLINGVPGGEDPEVCAFTHSFRPAVEIYSQLPRTALQIKRQSPPIQGISRLPRLRPRDCFRPIRFTSLSEADYRSPADHPFLARRRVRHYLLRNRTKEPT
jgi:hypothetical protein